MIIVDSREKQWSHIQKEFNEINCNYVQRKLDIGDYSFEITSDLLKGSNKYITFEKDIVFERKSSIDELALCFTKDRERFENEFKRKLEFCTECILIIEDSSLNSIRKHQYRSKIIPKSLEASLLAWKHRYKYELFFCNKSEMGLYMYNIFYYYLKEQLVKGAI